MQLRDRVAQRRHACVGTGDRQSVLGRHWRQRSTALGAGWCGIQRGIGSRSIGHLQPQRLLRAPARESTTAATRTGTRCGTADQTETGGARTGDHRCRTCIRRMRGAGTDVLRRHAGTGIGQRILQRAVDKIMHQPRITETHLVLGRVHVDINAGRVELKEQHIGRLATVVQHVAVSHLHRMGDAAVAHRTAVDVQVLLVGAGARIMRLRDPAVQAQAGTTVVDAHGLVGEILAQRFSQSRIGIQIARLVAARGLAVVRHAQLDIRPRQRQRTQPFFDMAQLGTLGAQELAPRRYVVEQLAHFYRGARRMRARGHFADLAAFDLQRRTVFVMCATRGQGETADRGDRRQRFTPEAERGHRFEVVQIGDLAGGMARYRQRQLFRCDATAVVADADQAYTALFKIDINAAGTGVDRVLDQLLDHRRGTFDHFAGGDLVDEDLRQRPDRARMGSRRHAGMITERPRVESSHARLTGYQQGPVEHESSRVPSGRVRAHGVAFIRRAPIGHGARLVSTESSKPPSAGYLLPPAMVPAASISAWARAAYNVPGGGWRLKKVCTPSSTAPAILRW